MVNQLRNIYQYLLKLNLYENETNDEHEKRNELLSTRIFIILLLLTLLLYIAYATLSSQQSSFIISKPTQKQYEQLQFKHPISLKCPCKDLSTPYKQLIDVKMEYYEICSSDFVKQEWIDYFFGEHISFYHPFDFRRSAAFKFQLLRTLCQQSQQTSEKYLEEFYSNSLISNEPVSSNEFHIQVNYSVELFKKTAISSFEKLVKLIQDIVCMNILLTAVDTRYFASNYTGPPFGSICYETKFRPQKLHCELEEELQGLFPEGIYDHIDYYDYSECDSPQNNTNGSNSQRPKNIPSFKVPGMFVLGLPIQSLMHSTLECLFEQSCLDKIVLHVKKTSISKKEFSILKQDSSTKTKTIKELTKNLFVKDWIIVRSYENYFNYCQPLYCQYLDEQKNSFVYIFTTTISLFGGLKLIFPWVALYVIKFIRMKESQQQSTDIGSHTIRIISLILFTFHISFDKPTKTLSFDTPTQIQYEQLYNNSFYHLQCPCSHISIKYAEFIKFQPTYHQICSSIFVSLLWRRLGNIWTQKTQCVLPDFANMARMYFLHLSKHCQISNETIRDELTRLYDMEYITSGVIHVKQFKSEIESFIENFKIQIQKSLKMKLNIIRSIIFDNQYRPLLKRVSNIVFHRNITVEYLPKDYEGCSCQTDSTCQRTMYLCRNDTFNYMQGVSMGCYISDSLLLSSISCFYDQNCINIFKRYMNKNEQLYHEFQPLKILEKNQYENNVTIETLTDNLFIEEWNDFYDYDKYYKSCQPLFCSYEIEERLSFLYILTRLISIYSGLTIITQFLIPNIVRLIRRKKQAPRVTTIFNRFCILSQLCKSKLIQMNIFRNKSTDLHLIRKQILSTRLYLITFSIILLICVFYTSLKSKLITNKLLLTHLTEYEQLYMKHPNTLICPCSEISIKYEEFIKLTPVYHEICSSNFVNQKWIDHLFQIGNLYHSSFHDVASLQFQVLKSLCRLIQETINSSLTQFDSTRLITNQLIREDIFENRINTIIKVFQKSTRQTFQEVFQISREIFHGNAFVSLSEKNWKYQIFKVNGKSISYALPVTYNNGQCTCATSLQCVQLATFNNTPIDGLFFGCYPIEAMLKSSLGCLYNKTCLELILPSSYQALPNLTIRILQSKTKYGINETVQHMIDRLFVDDWNQNYSYLNYSKKCRSTQCTYSFIQHFVVLHILTTILNLYGCLTILLRLLIPFIIGIFFRIYNRRRQMVIAPDIMTVD
ncbi:unnamed protein product [Adineta ricciae]|uniref:Uncharacterized protein n=1 Tax=Adineta ricciae TaxID=249248 RepID=A0A815YUJ5_ADIRI|nr:unnamed protein product [Adineta ricciae]CAF1575100.1 unnamed protein product [Adineta ricciae]